MPQYSPGGSRTGSPSPLYSFRVLSSGGSGPCLGPSHVLIQLPSPHAPVQSLILPVRVPQYNTRCCTSSLPNLTARGQVSNQPGTALAAPSDNTRRPPRGRCPAVLQGGPARDPGWVGNALRHVGMKQATSNLVKEDMSAAIARWERGGHICDRGCGLRNPVARRGLLAPPTTHRSSPQATTQRTVDAWAINQISGNIRCVPWCMALCCVYDAPWPPWRGLPYTLDHHLGPRDLLPFRTPL